MCVTETPSLAWVETPLAPAALRRSLDLNRLGDWTDDARQLVVFPQDAYAENAGSHDYTRVVLNAEPSPLERRRAGGSPCASQAWPGAIPAVTGQKGMS